VAQDSVPVLTEKTRKVAVSLPPPYIQNKITNLKWRVIIMTWENKKYHLLFYPLSLVLFFASLLQPIAGKPKIPNWRKTMPRCWDLRLRIKWAR
jgi:hypothetical protein